MSDEPDGELPDGDSLIALMEEGYKALLREISSDNVKADGVSGSASSPTMTIADRVKVLNAVKEFVAWRDKQQPPEKPKSGIDSLRDGIRADTAGRAGRSRRGT